MSTIEFPVKSNSPKTMLQNIAREHGDNFTAVMVIGYDENGEEFMYLSSDNLDFLARAQLAAQNLALAASRGELGIV